MKERGEEARRGQPDFPFQLPKGAAPVMGGACLEARGPGFMSLTHASYWLCDLGACLSLSGACFLSLSLSLLVKWVGSSLKTFLLRRCARLEFGGHGGASCGSVTVAASSLRSTSLHPKTSAEGHSISNWKLFSLLYPIGGFSSLRLRTVEIPSLVKQTEVLRNSYLCRRENPCRSLPLSGAFQVDFVPTADSRCGFQMSHLISRGMQRGTLSLLSAGRQQVAVSQRIPPCCFFK